MITTKRVLIAILLLLGAATAAVTGFYLAVSDATLVRLITARLEAVSGARISYQPGASVTRGLSPVLSVSDLVVADADKGYQFHTSSLRVQISLPRLLLGQLDIPVLWLGETRIESSGSAARSPYQPPPDGFSLPLEPALHDVRITRLSVVHEKGEMRLPAFDVDELSLDLEPGTDTLALLATMGLGEESITITVTLPDIHESLNKRDLTFSVSARSEIAALSAQGHVDLNKPQIRIDGSLSAEASDLKEIPTGIKGLTAPGRLTAAAQVHGTIEQLAVTQIAVDWSGSGESVLAVKGRIDDAFDMAGVELDVSGQLGESAWLTPVLPDTIGALQHTELAARLSGALKKLKVADFRFKARDANELDVSLTGGFELNTGKQGAEPENLDLKLAFAAPATRAARALLFDDIPEFGVIKGTADIRSVTGHPALENILVETRDQEGIEVDLKGRIASFPLDPDTSNQGYDLDVSMAATKTSLMGDRVGFELPIAGPLRMAYRIEGDTQALRLEQIDLNAGDRKALSVTATGQIFFRDWDQDDPLQTINLNLQAASHDTASLGALFGQQLPELGALSAKARVQTVSGRHRIKDFQLSTAKSATLVVSLEGLADDLLLLPHMAVEGIQLKAQASAADSARLNAVFGLEEAVPAIGPVTAQARISGTDRQLVINDVSVTAGQDDVLLVEAKGRLGNLAAENDWHPQHTDLTIDGRSSSSRALAKALGYTVPELGPLTAQAKFHDKDKTLGIESAEVLVGDKQAPVVTATGRVDDLFGAGDTHWDVKLDLDGHRFAEFADLQKLPDLGRLQGDLKISNQDGSLGIDHLQISSTASELLTIALEGRFDDFKKDETLVLNGKLTARDLALLGALLDRSWPAKGPVSIDVAAKRIDSGSAFDVAIKADDFELDAALSGKLAARPARLRGKVTMRNDFHMVFQERLSQDVKEKRAAKAKGPLFSREPLPLAWLERIDLDLAVEVESFDPDYSDAKSATYRLKANADGLALKPIRIFYDQGELDLELQLDTRDHPQLSFKARGESIDPWHAVRVQASAKEYQAGDIDINIDLKSSGASPHELAANAEGSVWIEMKHGKLRRSLVDLVFVDVVGWAWSTTTKDKFYDFECGIADYKVDNGVVTTTAFILDNPRLSITGEGTVDLGKEQIDYVFLPRKKSRVIRRADPVKVKGDLSDPKVKVIPWRSATATYGTLLFAPYIFVGITAADYLAGSLKGKAKESPCLAYEKSLKEKQGKAKAKADGASGQ